MKKVLMVILSGALILSVAGCSAISDKTGDKIKEAVESGFEEGKQAVESGWDDHKDEIMDGLEEGKKAVESGWNEHKDEIMDGFEEGKKKIMEGLDSKDITKDKLFEAAGIDVDDYKDLDWDKFVGKYKISDDMTIADLKGMLNDYTGDIDGMSINFIFNNTDKIKRTSNFSEDISKVCLFKGGTDTKVYICDYDSKNFTKTSLSKEIKLADILKEEFNTFSSKTVDAAYIDNLTKTMANSGIFDLNTDDSQKDMAFVFVVEYSDGSVFRVSYPEDKVPSEFDGIIKIMES